MPPDEGLSAEEIKFFETGDIAALGVAPPVPEPEPVPEVIVPAPVEAAPAPAPVPTPTPVPQMVSDGIAEQLAEDRRHYVQLQAQLAQLEARLAPPPPTAPDPATDPYGHLMHEISQIKASLGGIQQNAQLTQQQSAEQQQYATLQARAIAARNEFSAKTPDFGDAYTHLREARAQDLRDVGIPEDRISEALLGDELAVTQNALRRGKNPAEVIYGMAKRYGYTGKPPAANSAATTIPTPEQRMAQLQAGQQAALAPAKAAVAGELTLASLKDASDADLSKVASDDALWSKVMGGSSHDIFN